MPNPDHHELVRLVAQVTADSYNDSSAWRRLADLVGGFDNMVIRLDVQQRRLLACDRAERTFRQDTDTERQRAKVEASRRYARGKATEWEMLAAWSAAAQTRDGAWNAAWSAYSAAWSAYSASFAARADAERLAALPDEGRWQVCQAVDYMLGIRQ